MSFEIRDLDAPSGAEILSLNLTGMPDGAELSRSRQALAERGVPVGPRAVAAV